MNNSDRTCSNCRHNGGKANPFADISCHECRRPNLQKWEPLTLRQMYERGMLNVTETSNSSNVRLVVIKNFKMPKSCYDCPLTYSEYDGGPEHCSLTDMVVDYCLAYRAKDEMCPLVEVEV